MTRRRSSLGCCREVELALMLLGIVCSGAAQTYLATLPLDPGFLEAGGCFFCEPADWIFTGRRVAGHVCSFYDVDLYPPM
jgi:hypothetical protein